VLKVLNSNLGKYQICHQHPFNSISGAKNCRLFKSQMSASDWVRSGYYYPSSEKVKSGKLVLLAVGQSYLLIRRQLDLSKNTLLEKVKRQRSKASCG
jgi:hypothetical protein